MDERAIVRQARFQPAQFLLAVAAPLAVLAMAYGLWRFSDELLWIGPLDRAAFGWLVVVPFWATAPVAGAVASRTMSTRASALAGFTAAAAVAGPVALFVWQSVASPACPTGLIRSALEMMVPAIAIAAILGLGLGTAMFIGSEFWREGSRRAAVLSAVTIHLATSGLALALGPTFIIGPLCQRPPIP